VSYFILRNGQQYGPYAQTDLERYLAQGAILTTDLARTEAMNQWLPLAQMVGNVAAPAAPFGTAGAGYAGFNRQPQMSSIPGPALGQNVQPMPPPNSTPTCTGYPVPPQMQPSVPMPPGGLHWSIVLIGALLTSGLFGMIWSLVQANWIRKIDRQSKAMIFLIPSFALNILGQGINFSGEAPLLALLVLLAAAIAVWVGLFDMRGSMVRHYNSVENIGLKLSGVMTFFFGIVYFQYHLNKILKAKREQQPALWNQPPHYARPA
jgi:hypothetical protein